MLPLEPSDKMLMFFIRIKLSSKPLYTVIIYLSRHYALSSSSSSCFMSLKLSYITSLCSGWENTQCSDFLKPYLFMSIYCI